MSTSRSYIADSTPDWPESTTHIGNELELGLIERVPPVTPEQAAAATAYVRRRCADADVILAALGLDVTA